MTAPVLLITFNRPEHTRRTLQALIAQHPQELYVFQDGPRTNNEDDVKKCAQVQEVISECTDGLDTILHTHYSVENRGCRDAVIFAVSSVLAEHEAVIVVEDDIITSPAFLQYMNKALDYYKDRKTVFSISGHSPAPERMEMPADYPYDVFCSPRLFNWGWATWRDRWVQADWSMNYYETLQQHPEEIKAFNRGGEDLMPMLTDEKEGRGSAWDIQFAYAHFRNHAVSIVPCRSYTMNIGCDGSGTNCPASATAPLKDALNTNANPILIDTLYFDSRILNRLHSIYSPVKRPFYQRIINTLARMIGQKAPFVVKDPVYAK